MLDIRLRAEEIERRVLAPHACFSGATKGRLKPEAECIVRTAFQRDRDRIIHSKSFRRLKHKTQVFTIPEGDHYRTRLTHTLEVAQIARTIARALRLNEDLTEAIALGHDLGHTPFGHAGEEALNEVFEPGFKHNEQSLRVVDVLEGGGGLNLTFEVRDGILNHTGPVRPATLEGQIVKIADRVAYINHDIDDALRGGVLTREQLPVECLTVLGYEHRERINNMVLDLIYTNWDNAEGIVMSPAFQVATDRLREFLFEYVYIGSEAKREEAKARHVVKRLFRHFQENEGFLPGEYLKRTESNDTRRAICDYIAGMTDRYAIKVYQKYFLPVPWVE
ncbi:deoxyguanosinetriphosphate triphosphohydrolase [Pelotomaculum terephthalicicum JT]|uniref:deoxyguanosinetriphosphate triphosphohydrolase n=1 Tax=Pelotomaculum sp. PtaB.Bin117 TaxID=1811694 RepID=UPI0009CF23A4|nr:MULTISPECIES: deoxyguanosinetriphosphate triphosphohydrolase [Pelotomaculum]MCG9967072.1 deoxyguanosinetriphosphate triphosphohydrolase [Pelotomaculum terephthalicicum JT]OPX89259.1 MAG: Deoxyguanosinetriphosphate triphosphohydrolase [Pelotomaculum sp. PtaB.Bin117]OPY63882.1 MAG: Deoxyguanosinetriphosphate triphosphohydrolase [Pelotomaculum sp. PtaU1.Bin065]